MGKGTKKTKSVASCSKNKINKSLTKINENDLKSVNQGKERSCIARNENDQDLLTMEEDLENDKPEFSKNYINTPIFVKSIVKNSVIHNNNHALGLINASAVSKVHKEVIANQIKKFNSSKVVSLYNRRVTAVSWHPTYAQVFAAGSKGGDLLWHNLNISEGAEYYYHGIGPGGSILNLKFSREDPYVIYSASLTGKISQHHFHLRKNEAKILYSLSMDIDNWFTSLDICHNRKCMLAGDSKGKAYLLSDSGEPIWQGKKLHTSKVTHCQFNAHDPNIFVTSSNDHTVKLWDLRTVSSSNAKSIKHLASFPHLKAVNSAYFSPSNGVNILTTDQHSQLQVYSGPLWDKMIEITHPHRQFQFLTQIKAVWHPLEDIIIVGRFPDDNIQDNDSRTIDFYDGSNGELLYRILSPSNTIVSLNSMNNTGEILAAASGAHIRFLKDEQFFGDRHLTCSESDEDTESTALNLNNKKSDKKKVVKPIFKKKISSKKKLK